MQESRAHARAEGVNLSGSVFRKRLQADSALENPEFGCRRCKYGVVTYESLRQKDGEPHIVFPLFFRHFLQSAAYPRSAFLFYRGLYGSPSRIVGPVSRRRLLCDLAVGGSGTCLFYVKKTPGVGRTSGVYLCYHASERDLVLDVFFKLGDRDTHLLHRVSVADGDAAVFL